MPNIYLYALYAVISHVGHRTAGKTRPLKAEKPRWKSDIPLTQGQLRSKRDEFWDTAPAFEGTCLLSTRAYSQIFFYEFIQCGSWNNSLNWRKVFKCLNFIWQTWYLKYKLFNWCFCPWVFWLLWKPKLFFRTFITTRISIFWRILSGNIAQN